MKSPHMWLVARVSAPGHVRDGKGEEGGCIDGHCAVLQVSNGLLYSLQVLLLDIVGHKHGA